MSSLKAFTAKLKTMPFGISLQNRLKFIGHRLRISFLPLLLFLSPILSFFIQAIYL